MTIKKLIAWSLFSAAPITWVQCCETFEQRKSNLKKWYDDLHLQFNNEYMYEMTALYSGIEFDMNTLREAYNRGEIDFQEFTRRKVELERLLARQKSLLEDELHKSRDKLNDAFDQRMAELRARYGK